jgi:hypothetical protein
MSGARRWQISSAPFHPEQYEGIALMSEEMIGNMDDIAKFLLTKSRQESGLTIGPLVWYPASECEITGCDPHAKVWCSIVGGTHQTKRRGTKWHCDSMVFGLDLNEAKELRAELIAALQRHCEVHVFDDELEHAKFCVERWPCDKNKRILADVRNRRARDAFANMVREYPEISIEEFHEKLASGEMRGRVGHTVYAHEPWCKTLATGNGFDCTCNPDVSVHLQPTEH